jgi:prepilin-type processing-associated H-X9-DG protein
MFESVKRYSLKQVLKKLKIKILRLIKFSPYLFNRISGRAYRELEINLKQILQHSFIPSGKKNLTTPSGYFSNSNAKLKIIEDVKGLPNVLWINHSHTNISQPLYGSTNNSSEENWKIPLASFILEISNGYVAPSGLIFDHKYAYRNGKWYYEFPPSKRPTKHVDKIITFVQIWGWNFVHFIFDTLPRINFSYDLICREQDIKILMPKPRSPYMLEMLETIGIDRSRIIFQKPGYVYSADTVYYPHFYNKGKPQQMGLIPPKSLEKIRSKLAGPYTKPQKKIIYLKRKKNCKRCVENEEDLLKTIDKNLSNNFTLKVFEPFNDWIKDKEVLKQAKVVLGPHGGAWSNILFCDEKTDVIEFLPLASIKKRGKNERPCFYGLANALNLSYWSVEPFNFNFERPGRGMTVPINEVLSVLNRVGVLKA